jgi:hypothetical protein
VAPNRNDLSRVVIEKVTLQKMEAVGQNATLFPKSQISANFISAQLLYFQQMKKLVSKVAKVSKVTFSGRFSSFY